MCRTDLTDTQIKLNWAIAQTEKLGPKISAFFEGNVNGPIIQDNPDGDGRFFVFDIAGPIPGDIQGDVGAIIYMLRSRLDTLMVALAEKQGSRSIRDVYFPIGDHAGVLDQNRALKSFAEIDPADADVIRALKPYKGGNDLLFVLSTLCNQDKHRKLNPISTIQGFEYGGFGHIRTHTQWLANPGPDQYQIINLIDAEPGIEINFAFNIGLSNVEAFAQRPLVSVLSELTGAVDSIIDLFR